VISGIFRGPFSAPEVIKKEPPLAIIQPVVDDTHGGAGTSPLNLFQLAPGSMTVLANGHLQLQFAGIPLKKYDLQGSSSPSSTSFVTIAPGLTADSSGHIFFEDPNPGVTHFYRIIYNPNAPGN
jgi:hypothetical protein